MSEKDIEIEKEEEINLRSEEVQEIMGRVPTQSVIYGGMLSRGADSTFFRARLLGKYGKIRYLSRLILHIQIMGKKHVFNAGPCVLPQAVIDNTIEALKDFKGTGVSLLSISHRTKGWDETMDECRALWKEILDIPEGYEVVFLGGGASLEFLYVAMNYLEHKAGYLETGVWAKKALKEAKGLGEAFAVASSADKNYSYIPKGYEIPKDLDYFHITTNNTIYGTEIKEDIDCPVPLIADMSSDIMSRRVDVSKYTMIYGGAQKNVGPAGVTFAIIKKDSLGKVSRYLPTMLDLRTHIDKLSMFNTPPVFGIFVMNEMLKWLKGMGGIDAYFG